MTGNDACWQTDKVDLSKNWKTSNWIPPLQGNWAIFYLCFCQHDAFSVDIDILCPSLGSVFLESALFSHPEIYWQSWPQQKLEDVDLDSTFAGKPGNFFSENSQQIFSIQVLANVMPFSVDLDIFSPSLGTQGFTFLRSCIFFSPGNF